MTKVLLWSGGFDSTLVLLDLIAAGESVVAVSIIHDLTGTSKLNREIKARSEIKAYIAANFPDADVTFVNQRIPEPNIVHGNSMIYLLF